MPANRYWEETFVTQGSTITGGYLLLGANQDGLDHRGKIGIYTGTNRAGELGSTVQAVSGYGGVNFTFSSAIPVQPGQTLYFAATGVGDFTAYDSSAKCFVGRIDGFS